MERNNVQDFDAVVMNGLSTEDLPDANTKKGALPPIRFKDDIIKELDDESHFVSVKNFSEKKKLPPLQRKTESDDEPQHRKESVGALIATIHETSEEPNYHDNDEDNDNDTNNYYNDECGGDNTDGGKSSRGLSLLSSNNHSEHRVIIKDDGEEDEDEKEEVFFTMSNTHNHHKAISLKQENPDYRKIAIELASVKKNAGKQKRLKSCCDYALVYEVDDQDVITSTERARFEAALKEDGLELVYTLHGELMFVEVYASFERLCKQAEAIYLDMPLEGFQLSRSTDQGMFKKWHKSMKTDNEADMVSAPFSYASRHLFHGIKNYRTFFRSAYRSMLVHNILDNTKITLIDSSNDGSTNMHSKTGIRALIHSKAYKDALIFHEKSEYDSKFPLKMKTNSIYYADVVDSRKDLHDTWLKCFKYQPLWKIRNYYGEKIGLYFAWLGVLISSLWVPVFLGLGVFVYGFIVASRNDTDNVNISKVLIWLSYAFDNDATPFFALIICLWGGIERDEWHETGKKELTKKSRPITFLRISSTVFLEVWKRKNNELAYKWDVDSFEEQEPNRPEFYGTRLLKDPLTGIYEPYYPRWRKTVKSMGSGAVFVFMILLVVVSVASVVVFKVVSRVDWFSSISSGSLASSLLSSILNTVSILLLGRIYKLLAYKLTKWENHQTRTQYDDALVLKLFGFQFVNSYASLFYIAFFRERTSDGVLSLGSNYADDCGANNDCMSLLSIQVATLMIAKPLPKFTTDIILPFMTKSLKRLCSCLRKSKINASDIHFENNSDGEYEEYLMREYLRPPLGEFTLTEYTEKVLQYGYLMLFAAAFPLAPIIALLTNIIDLRIDARRMLWFNRRPVPQRAEDIGMWFTILLFLNFIGIFTNAFIIGFTSRFGRKYQTTVVQYNITGMVQNCSLINEKSNEGSVNIRLSAYENLWIIIIFENVALAIKFLLAYLIPDTPAPVERAKRQEQIQLNNLLKQSGLKVGPGKTFQSHSHVDGVDGPPVTAEVEPDPHKRKKKRKSKKEMSTEN